MHYIPGFFKWLSVQIISVQKTVPIISSKVIINYLKSHKPHSKFSNVCLKTPLYPVKLKSNPNENSPANEWAIFPNSKNYIYSLYNLLGISGWLRFLLYILSTSIYYWSTCINLQMWISRMHDILRNDFLWWFGVGTKWINIYKHINTRFAIYTRTYYGIYEIYIYKIWHSTIKVWECKYFVNSKSCGKTTLPWQKTMFWVVVMCN